MIARRTSIVAACVVLAAACGKRGNPLPPLRPVPAAIQDLSARRMDGRVELSFTVPAANADGSTPVAIDRIEIVAVPVTTGATSRPLSQLLADAANIRTTIPVRVPKPDDAPAPRAADTAASAPTPAAARGDASAKPSPVPGERVSFVDDPAALATAGVTSLNYIAVGVVGGGRGRKGPASPVVSVSLAEPPPAPTGLAATHDERSLTVTWARVTGQQVLLFDVPKSTASAQPGAAPATRQVTPSPVTTGTFSEPVVFGVERCFTARAVRVSGAATVVGPAASVLCVTPVDHYPPPAPASLQAIQEGAVVTLNWAKVDAADLAGYMVLRGDGAGETMRPLMRQPITDTTFSDTQVVPGATYTYSVYALDNAPIPNVSQQSARQSVTVR